MEFPEAEIAYIAMHLSAALMGTNLLEKLTARVIVACPTGMGTSRLLAGQLKKYYAESLVIVDQAAALQLAPGYFELHKADFIISTVPVPEVPLPVVTVNALLTEADRREIDEAVRLIGEKQVEKKAQKKVQVDFQSALRVLSVYSSAILSLLDNFFFLDEQKAMTVQEAAAAIGKRVAEDHAQAKEIEKALLAREDQGSTAI